MAKASESRDNPPSEEIPLALSGGCRHYNRIRGCMMRQAPVRTARIEARIAPDALAIVKRAAEIQGRSVSDSSSRRTGGRTADDREDRNHPSRPSRSTPPFPKRSSTAGALLGPQESSSGHRRLFVKSVTPCRHRSSEPRARPTAFSSGVDVLDRYLAGIRIARHAARVADASSRSTTPAIVGFYTLARQVSRSMPLPIRY